ncbi:MAG: hypothetical protein AAF183_04895 [Pseudomonadota bacterium]
MSTPIEPDDLASAVSAGIVTEAQAASLASLAQTRAGLRARMPKEDEPFELFRGLNEVFVAAGVVLLIAGGVMLAGLGTGSAGIAGVMGVLICWLLAEYFTLKRRMVLPSIVLCAGTGIFAVQAGIAVLLDIVRGGADAIAADVAQGFGIGAVVVLAFFVRFRLPFAVFLTGLCSLPPLFLVTDTLSGPLSFVSLWRDPMRIFDLATALPVALVMLGFGLMAFTLAMAFDVRDPHRIGRLSRCGFWLHLLAAPAIVNTLALSLYRMGTETALFALVGVIALMTLVALVIDRRSFLLSAVAYLGLLLTLAFEEARAEIAVPAVLLILGTGVTALGTGWTSLRGRLMRALPLGGVRDYLPPYQTVRSAP